MSEPAAHRGWWLNGDRVRRERRRRCWTVDELAERLRRLAVWRHQPCLELDTETVAAWEEGRTPLTITQLRLLALLLEAPTDELIGSGGACGTDREAPERIPPSAEEAGDVGRHAYLRYLLMLAGANILDPTAWSGAQRLDGVVLDEMAALTGHFEEQLWAAAPSSLLPLVRVHLSDLRARLDSGPPALRPRLRRLICQTAILAGHLARHLDNRGDALVHWRLAEAMATQAQEGPLRAHALIERAWLYSSVPIAPGPTDSQKTVELLDEAQRSAGPAASPYLRAWLFARRAEEFAVMGALGATYHELDRAERALGSATGKPAGYFAPWEGARLAGYRGSCALRLGDDRRAIAILEGALAGTSPKLPSHRSAVLLDLATANAHLGEVDHACQLLTTALNLGVAGQLPEKVQTVAAIRQRHLQPWQDEPVVKRLDQQLHQVL